MRTVAIEGMYFYGYHGYLKEERIIGNRFRVDVYVKTPYERDAASDDLSKTIDYGVIYELVRKEMKQSSKLLEDVAQRIITAFEKEFKKRIENQEVHQLTVKVTKFHPPVEGQVDNASVALTEHYSSSN